MSQKPAKSKPKQQTWSKREAESIDLLPREEALKRTEDLLRTLLNSPPAPRSRPKKRAK